MGFIQRRLVTAVLFTVRHPLVTLSVSAVVLVGCIALAVFRLGISTDQDALFSPHVPFFKAYLDFEDKFPENEALYVLIQTASPAASPPSARWTAAADALVNRLRKVNPEVINADCGIKPSELGRQGLLYDDPDEVHADFAQAKDFARLAALWGKPSLAARLLGDTPIQRFLRALAIAPPDADAARFVQHICDGWIATLRQPNVPLGIGNQVPDLATMDASDPRDLGYNYVPDASDPSRHLLLIQVYLNDDPNASEIEQVEAVRNAVSEVTPLFPEFNVGVTGRPALDADETQTSDSDSQHAEIVAMIVVFIGLWVTLASLWLAIVAEIALGVGIGWTFGWATVSVGELNLLSLVFLITLIGIGMDYLIQILTRYRREARRYQRPAAVWVRVFRYVSPPITTACLGAAGAFFVSIFTDFRGAAELGIIAGGGLLLCLVAGYTVLPAMLVLWPAKVGSVDPDARYGKPPRRRGVARLVLPAAWMAALAIVVPNIDKTSFNPNLLDMQAQSLSSVKLIHRLQTWSAVAMSPDLSTLRRLRDAVAASPLVADTDSILNAYDNYLWLQQHKADLPQIDWGQPTPLRTSDIADVASATNALANRYEKLFPDAAIDLRHFMDVLSSADTDQAAQRLSAWQVLFVQELSQSLAQLSPPPPDINQLPAELKTHLVSSNGEYALYIDPKEDLWKRQPLAAFVQDIERRADKEFPNHPIITGIAPEMYHSTSVIEKAFEKATFLALGLVVVLVLLDLRSVTQTLVTVSVLALGLPMLAGLMGIFRIDWNFANFFGLPILIGAGHEYGVFMMHRYREVRHNPRRRWGSWDVSDRALLLCAFVTTSSFAFFAAFGHHLGLRSLGIVMAMGIACIYLAAVMVVRPLLKWWIERNFCETIQSDDARIEAELVHK